MSIAVEFCGKTLTYTKKKDIINSKPMYHFCHCGTPATEVTCIVRNHIVLAAAEELKSRGVKFTMSDLAKRLSLSKTTLYDYFATKSDLIQELVNRGIQDIQEQEEEIYKNTQLSTAEKIQRLLKINQKVLGPVYSRAIYDDFRHYYPHHYQQISDFRQESLDKLMALVRRGIEEHVLHPVNVSVFRQLIISALDDLYSFQFLEKNNMTYADALAAFADILLCGLLPQK